MESVELLPLIVFIAVTTYTHGPNNVSSASMGLMFGFTESLPYMAGIASGFVIVMLLCGSMSGVLIKTLPVLARWLRWAGCAYILWLAWGTFRATYSFDTDGETRKMGFLKGMFLQLLNVKVIVYGITLYTTFLSPLTGRYVCLVVSALVLAVLSFSSVALWAMCGTALKKFIGNPGIRKYINVSLSLLLVYTALMLLKA